MKRNDFHVGLVFAAIAGCGFTYIFLELTTIKEKVSTWGTFGDSINPWITIVALIFAYLSWNTAIIAKNTESNNFLRTSAYENVLAEIRDRVFEVRPNHKLPKPNGNLKHLKLRLVKAIARKSIANGAIGWDRASQEEWDKTSSNQNLNWKSDLAFEVGDSLQQLGILAITGAMPLGPTLMHTSIVLINDWLLCAAWVKRHSQTNNVKSNFLETEIYFPRRHAEWFALIAIAHMRKYKWNIDEIYPNNPHIPDRDSLERRIKLLSNLDSWGIPVEVRVEVKKITGLSI